MAMPPSWSIDNPADPVAVARRARAAADYAFWRHCQPVTAPDNEEDWTTLSARLTRSTGMSRKYLTSHLDALHTLDELPRLKELIEATHLLDMHHLRVIDAAVMRAPLGLKDDPYFWECLDEELLARFTPTRPHQLLPGGHAIRRVVADVIRTLQVPADTDSDPAPLMRGLPPAEEGKLGPELFHSETLDNGDMRFEFVVDQATGTELLDAVSGTATGRARTLVDLVRGKTTTTVTMNLYSAADVPGAPVFHPTQGVLTEEAAAKLREQVSGWFDMDKAATAGTGAYSPTPLIRRYLDGRDWICRWPGCTVRAEYCDADHALNHADGGPTTPGNMILLCRHHHNRKTDRQVRYVLDPHSGDVIWLFGDGTYVIDHATGPLSPTEKRWTQTYAQRRARRSEAAAARAAAEEFDAYQRSHENRERKEEPYPDDPPF